VGGVEPAPLLALTIAQGLAAVSLGRPRAAEQAAARVRTQLSDWTPPDYLADEALRLTTDLALVTGDAGRPAGPTPGPSHGTRPSLTGQAGRARLLLARGDLPGARQAAQSVISGPDGATLADLVARVEAGIVLAQVAARRHLLVEAGDALAHAVDLAEPNRILRPFLVAAGGIAPLRDALDAVPVRPFVRELVARLDQGRPSAPEPQPLIEPLTARELAVLAELATMKSNSEIAAGSYVSVNTVKAHLKGVYRKLDVSNRRDAVRRARALGLLA
ncbi:MAG: LuxR C-terminal-related transcriptional regulator, partial [Propionicimonas sp.]